MRVTKLLNMQKLYTQGNMVAINAMLGKHKASKLYENKSYDKYW